MTRKTIEIAAAAIAIALLTISLQAWRAQKKEESQMKDALDARQKLVTDANGREAEREQRLKSALRDITNLKKRTRTPLQVLRELPKYLPLPQPVVVNQLSAQETDQNITMRPTKPLTPSTRAIDLDATASHNPGTHTVPNASTPAQNPGQSSIEMPAQDLKPLFNFVQDCRVCDAKLRAAQADTTDDGIKLMALTKQRDLAVNSAKGGSFGQRVKSHLRWLAAGAAIGFLAAYRKG
ncbi:MAG TPA: hypothetical protein VIY69_08835 [Candidatus Acidoferrales bacterium]